MREPFFISGKIRGKRQNKYESRERTQVRRIRSPRYRKSTASIATPNPPKNPAKICAGL